jgi:hypothetical protein
MLHVKMYCLADANHLAEFEGLLNAQENKDIVIKDIDKGYDKDGFYRVYVMYKDVEEKPDYIKHPVKLSGDEMNQVSFPSIDLQIPNSEGEF